MIERTLHAFACDLSTGLVFAQRAHIHQHQMVVCAITDDAQAFILQRFTQCLRIIQHLLLIGFELWLQCFAQSNRLATMCIRGPPC